MIEIYVSTFQALACQLMEAGLIGAGWAVQERRAIARSVMEGQNAGDGNATRQRVRFETMCQQPSHANPTQLLPSLPCSYP